jgi:2-dehydro-3-deoxyphosphogluconate aldolase/(4S)-4-hydroxy-2-oxoglutarate aldolase
MNRDQIVAHLAATGIVPCWRCDDTVAIIDATKALIDGGLTTVELTMTMPGNLRLIERACAELPPGTLVGAGTVLDAETARLAILAGAKYVVSPCLVPEIITMCHRYGVAAVIGAFSPTEIMTAKSLGADVLKLYPAGMGGAAHIGETLSVFPGIRTVVSGGVLLGDIGGFITAGADCAVVGLPQIGGTAYAERRFGELTRIAERLVGIAREARDPAAKRRMGEEFLARYTDLAPRAAARAAR